jgi:hypothetical protein
MMTTRRRLPEHELQAECVAWFRYTYPWYSPLLFAVPNGAKRNKAEAAIKKAEGMNAGVADLILLVNNGVFGSLCIEMKAGSSMSEAQKRFFAYTGVGGQRYVVIKSKEDFQQEVNEYLGKVDPELVRVAKQLYKAECEKTVLKARKEYERMKERMEENEEPF